MLLSRSRSKTNSHYVPSFESDEKVSNPGHVNFFQELEDGTSEQQQTNKEHEKEKKEEKEKYEKQIGYLTYLGQDTNEALGKKNWYEVAPDRAESKTEVNLKNKIRDDPLEMIKKYTSVAKKASEFYHDSTKLIEYQSVLKGLGTSSVPTNQNKSGIYSSDSDVSVTHKSKKHKKRKKARYQNSSSESSDEKNSIAKQKKIELLREERLKREKEERRRAEMLLSKITANSSKEHSKNDVSFKPRYNSQFNPEIAKQNYVKY